MTTLAQDAVQGNRRSANSDPDEIVVAEWAITKRETVRVILSLYRGKWRIDSRRWFEGEDGEIKPGKGISLSIEYLPRLTDAAAKALILAQERGLIAPPNSPAAGLGGVSCETKTGHA